MSLSPTVRRQRPAPRLQGEPVSDTHIHTYTITALRRQRQVDLYVFKANLVYIVSSRSPCIQKIYFPREGYLRSPQSAWHV